MRSREGVGSRRSGEQSVLIGSDRIEPLIIAKSNAIGSRCRKGCRNIELGITAKNDACRVQQEEIGIATGYFKRAIDERSITTSHTPQNILNIRIRLKIRNLSSIQSKLAKTMKEVTAAPCSSFN